MPLKKQTGNWKAKQRLALEAQLEKQEHLWEQLEFGIKHTERTQLLIQQHRDKLQALDEALTWSASEYMARAREDSSFHKVKL